MSESSEVLPDKTAMGTRVRESWTKEYYNYVLRIEKNERRPICGAPTKNNYPCRKPPQEHYSDYCGIHRPRKSKGNPREDQAGNSPPAVSTNIVKTEEPILEHVHSRDEIVMTFHQCNNCYIRDTCPKGEVDNHCRIQEDGFYTFIDTVRQDYEIQQIDMFMIYKVAIAYVKGMYADIIQKEYLPASDEYHDQHMTAVRLSKEYREGLKALGLTRHQRNTYYQKDMKLGVEAVKAQSQASLAETMARAALEMPKIAEHKPHKVVSTQSVEDE
ncbi:MAG: hypothetical protein ACXAC2_00500 [Candidatus Kariarchaeaceae archaeon]|jgi:hypothetical protein